MANELANIERQLMPMAPLFEQLLAPTGIPATRIIRSVLISCERTPLLLECTPISVIQAATTGAVLGLEADGHTGQGFLVPFFNNKKRAREAQWLTGYKGFNTLGARSGLTIDGAVVREGDDFEYEEGTSPYVRFRRKLGGGAGRRIIAAYATATARDRPPIVRVLDLDDINFVKGRSQAAKKGGDDGSDAFSPWNDPSIGFPAMAEKTAKRRLARSMPLSVYVHAARVDEAHEEQGAHSYIHPEKGVVIEGTATPVRGAPAGALRAPGFVIKGFHEDRTVNSIEEWRAGMIAAIRGIRTQETVERFRDLNAAVMDDYRDNHQADVRAVAATFEEKLR